MSTESLPKLSDEELSQYFIEAERSPRKRFPKIIHNQGDYHNKVINFVLYDSYMQPHLHPGNEKIEKMYLLAGSFALMLFDEKGEISSTIILEKGGRESVNVPAFTWHTYVMLTEKVVIYETMEGVYKPSTWKKMASWAPLENTSEAINYLNILKIKTR
jgi:cupin fold WbuC family metalloprotein